MLYTWDVCAHRVPSRIPPHASDVGLERNGKMDLDACVLMVTMMVVCHVRWSKRANARWLPILSGSITGVFVGLGLSRSAFSVFVLGCSLGSSVIAALISLTRRLFSMPTSASARKASYKYRETALVRKLPRARTCRAAAQ